MKKTLLSLLLAVTWLTSFSQNWIEVGVDTQFGPKFRPNDVEFVHDSLILVCGSSYDYNNHVNAIKNGFLKSVDGGVSWDTLYYFNSGFNLGDNYQIAVLDSLIFILHGTGGNRGGTYTQYDPFCSAYVLDLYNDKLEFQRTISHSNGFGVEFINRIEPISNNTLGLIVEYPDSSTFLYDKFALLDLNSSQQDTISLPVNFESINDIKFVDSLTGYIACGSVYREQSGYLLKTVDGGNTWQVIKDNSTSAFRCVEFYDRNIGISSSGQGLMYFTRDGGFDWFPVIGIPTRFRAYDITKAGENDAYAIGIYSFFDNGQSLSYTQIYRSSNRGKSWCLVYEDTSFSNLSTKCIAFADENHGVAAFDYNRLIYTTNGGGLTECVTNINEAEEAPLLGVYPNPSNGSFTISLPSDLKAHDLRIYDLSGSVVKQMQVPSTSVLVNGLSSGMYILQVQTSDGVLTQKLVVE